LSVDRGGLTAGVLEGIHFAVQDGANLLHAAVVAAPEDRIAVDDHGADRNAALPESLSRLLNRLFEEPVSRSHWLLLLQAPRNLAVGHAQSTIRQNLF